MLAALVFGACLGQRSDLATPEPLRPTSTRAAGPEPTAAAVIDANPATLLARAVCWYEDPARAASCVPPPQDVLDAIAAMGASRDRRFVAPLVDMRAVDVGWGAEVDAALEQLTGERHDAQADWHRWLGVHPGALPPGYLQWKGRLLGINPYGQPGVEFYKQNMNRILGRR